MIVMNVQRIQWKGPKNSRIEDARLRVAADLMVKGCFDGCMVRVSSLGTNK